MLVVWLMHATLVAALLGAAAWCGESALRGAGRPGRWIWAAALVASVLLPAAARWSPGLIPAPVVVPLPELVVGGSELVGDAATAAAPDAGSVPVGAMRGGLDRLLLALWLTGTVAVAAYLGVSALRLRARRRGWRAGELAGRPVWVSDRTGPAALGLVVRGIVVPEWVLRLDRRAQSVLLLHEEEHLRAGDARLVALGLAAVALMPWNPAVWWQYRRLRLAIELDCDARVVRRVGDPAAYGRVLLEVGSRQTSFRPLSAAFHTTSMLERRIRMMLRSTTRASAVRTGVLASLAGGLLVLACFAPEPTKPPEADPPAATVEGDDAAPEPPRQVRDASERPQFTPFDTHPRRLNDAEIMRALQRAYPAELRDAGIGGTVNVWFFIDEQGEVQDIRVAQSSGHEALDRAALETARAFRFEPATNRDQPVAVWVQFPVTFRPTPSD